MCVCVVNLRRYIIFEHTQNCLTTPVYYVENIEIDDMSIMIRDIEVLFRKLETVL